MALQTFPNFPPTRNSKLTTETRILKAGFGDGYEQIVEDGINTSMEEWSLNFDDYPKADADVIIAFLKSHNSVRSFLWKSPADSSAKQWRQDGKLNVSYPGHETVTLSFNIKRTYTL